MKNDINTLCGTIRQTSYDIHVFLGQGHLEKVYENALRHRLEKQGILTQQQCPIQVFDEDDSLLGEYFADLLVEERVIVELKACRMIHREHEAQILGYLKASRIEHGMLINFGSYRFQSRKYILTR